MAKLMPNSSPPELRHVAPDLVPRHDEDAFHDGDDERKPDGQRHGQEMVHGRQRELQP
jgi:hypothetical protein